MLAKPRFWYLVSKAIKSTYLGQTKNMVSDEIDEVLEPSDPHEKFWRYFIYFGILLCFVMTYFQYSRAISGNQRSWTYVFEWPVLGGIGIWMIWRVRKEILNPTDFSQDLDDPNDIELRNWKLHVQSLESDQEDRNKI
jgi:hypothetical protein